MYDFNRVFISNRFFLIERENQQIFESFTVTLGELEE